MLRVVISDISQLKAAEIQTSERLKELACLDDVSRLALNPGLTEQQLCQKVVERLIPALGHPEIAAAEIRLNGKVYQSPNFSNSFNSRLNSPILHNNEQCGELTVCYTRAASFNLPEEQNLLDNIASTIGLWNERKISDKDVKKLSQAVEQSPLSILITKPDGTIEYSNAHFCNLTGYSLSEIVGKNPRILQSNFTSKEEYKLLWETILSGQIWEGKFLNIKKDGTLFWEKATIAPMFDEMGRIIHFLAVKENITAQTIMENDLHQSESHNRALLDAIPDLIFRIRRDGIILDCKAGLSNHLLKYPEKLIGTSIYDQLDESIAVDVKNLINQTLRSGQVQSMNIEIKLKDGSHVFEARLKGIGNTEVVAIVRDISEQSRLAQMKTDFINRASHELRTPIATMLLMADLLDGKMQGENADEYWDVLKSELQRERGLIEHLLNTGLLEGDQNQVHFRALEIDALIQQAVHSFEPAAREKGISLNLASIPADEHTAPRLVQGDQHGLNLVLTNLVGNAIKFTPRGGNVSIQTQGVDGNLLISIIDSGIGIPSEDLPLLFSRFFRGSNAIDEEIQGTGLGLYLVRSILDKHNGSIQVTSQQGIGSRFDVRLPL
jgi:PAS domain S-box-containing protein